MRGPPALLRTEGAVVAAGAIGAYVLQDGSLLLFVAIILVPDLSMAGYLFSARVGVDRLFGFGLKYGDAEFSDTHLQRV